MIYFVSHHGFGIQLFNYAFARCLAEKYSMQLKHVGHEGYNLISSGNEFILPKYFDLDFNLKGRSLSGEPAHYIDRHIFPFAVANQNLPLYLEGWYENFSQIEEYSDSLKTWIIPKYQYPISAGVCVHVRLGDKGSGHIKKDYYYDSLDMLGEKTDITWFTDCPSDSFMQELVAEKGGKIVSGSFIDDFFKMMSFKNIIISDSTYSWWAAWLGQAVTIIALKKGINKYGGYWQYAEMDDNGRIDNSGWIGVDYWPKESRYIYI